MRNHTITTRISCQSSHLKVSDLQGWFGCLLVFCSTFLFRFLEHLHYVVFKCVAAEKMMIRILGLLSCVLPKFPHFAILFPPSCLPSNKLSRGLHKENLWKRVCSRKSSYEIHLHAVTNKLCGKKKRAFRITIALESIRIKNMKLPFWCLDWLLIVNKRKSSDSNIGMQFMIHRLLAKIMAQMRFGWFDVRRLRT